jgi:hypothetical protein
VPPTHPRVVGAVGEPGGLGAMVRGFGPADRANAWSEVAVRMSRGLRVLVLRDRVRPRRRMLAGSSALVAFAVLAVLALLPSAAAALNRNPGNRVLGVNPSATSGCFTDDSQTDFEAGTPNGCDLTTNPGSVQLSVASPFRDQSNGTLGTSGVGNDDDVGRADVHTRSDRSAGPGRCQPLL